MAEMKPESFDLLSAIAGINYPEHEVRVYLDESVGFAYYTLSRAYELAASTGQLEKAETIQKELDELAEESKNTALTVKLRGIPEQIRGDIVAEVEEAHPTKMNFMGQQESNPAGDRMLRRELWSQMIVSITGPDGKVNVPGEAEINALLSQGGSTLYEIIDTGIGELISGTKSGFEAQAKNIDFLSEASQEDSEKE